MGLFKLIKQRKQVFNLLLYIHLLLLVIAAFAGILFITQTWFAAVCFFLIFIITCLGIREIMQMDKRVETFIENQINMVAFANKDLANTMPLPYCVIDRERIVQWYSPSFAELYDLQVIRNREINELMPDFDAAQDAGFELALKDRIYAVYPKDFMDENAVDGDKSRLTALFLFDRTEELQLTKKLEHEKTAVAFVFIDNYDEVLSTLEDFRHSLLIGLVDRKIASLAEQLSGIVRKFENDKYLLVFSAKHLNTLKERKFDILEQVRGISIGEHQPVTLSFGIGINGCSLAQSMQFARSAIDLALGRGGDQALIKDNDKLTFCGGKSQSFEQNTRVRARVKAYAFSELIDESSNVLVMGHANPDLDSFGACLGVYRIVVSQNKRCNIVLNQFGKSIENLHDRMSSIAEYKETIVTDAVALGLISDKTLVVVVDTFRLPLVEAPSVLSAAKKIVVFDHHRKSADFIDNAVFTYHEPYASATCELITEILQYIKGDVRLKPLEADALLAGITMDTKGFTFKSGAKTFEAAAYLRRSGADGIRVKNMLKNDMETYKAKAAAVREAEIYHKNMAISTCPTDVKNPTLVAAQAADDLLNISDIEASFVLCHHDGRIIISARSVGTLNVQVIMEELGGGGHQTIAGAQLDDATIYSARDRLKEAISKYLKEG